jgi:hypothetical protein
MRKRKFCGSTITYIHMHKLSTDSLRHRAHGDVIIGCLCKPRSCWQKCATKQTYRTCLSQLLLHSLRIFSPNYTSPSHSYKIIKKKSLWGKSRTDKVARYSTDLSCQESRQQDAGCVDKNTVNVSCLHESDPFYVLHSHLQRADHPMPILSRR